MPSDKRARQRAQREAKLSEVQRRRRRVRRLRQGASALVVAGLVVLVIVLVSQPSPKPKKAASSTTTSVTTTTLAAAVAPTCPPATAAGATKRVTAFTRQPPICISRGVTYDATVVTDVGTFVIQLLPTAQLRAVNNFVFLARYHFFNSSTFQRVIPGFVVQGGEPSTTVSGPGYEWTGNEPPPSCEAAKDCYAPYDVAYANSGSTPKTNESQFFIVLPGGQDQLAPDYTLFGKVISGFAVVRKIGADGSSSGTPNVTHHMVSVTISTAG
jgi:cyclophilin family peptidyl-prolyl cis-trans isomerase